MEDVQISQIHVLQSDYSQNRLKRSIIYNVGSTRQSKGPFLGIALAMSKCKMQFFDHIPIAESGYSL